MKIKALILSALLFPIALFGATNAFDNVTVRVSEIGRGTLVWTNGVDGTSTNYLSSTRIFGRASDGRLLTFVSTNGGAVSGRLSDNLTGTAFTLSTDSGNADITMNGTLAQISFMSGNYTMLGNGFTSSVAVTITHNGNVFANSNLTVGANTTLGDGASRTITFNANTATVVGQLNFNANTFSITNGAILVGSPTNATGGNAKVYVNGNVRADNYFYNILKTAYSATGTNSIDFSTNMVVNITNVTAGITLTSANLMAGRSVDVIFQGTTSNILLVVPTGWIPVSQTFAAVVTNKYVVIHALSLGTTDANVLYSITQQP